MTAMLNIIAILFFITALVLFGIRIVRAYKRDGMKGGIIAKGNWGLWAAGVVALFIGLGLRAVATAYGPPDVVPQAENKAMSQFFDAPTSSSIQATTQDNSPTSKDVATGGSSEKIATPLPASVAAGPLASEPPADAPTPSDASTSHPATRAGNPSPSQIIIFQFDGANGSEPAYCADEGADGVMCRSDSLTEIGRGTYKDYMIPGSKTCIAGAQGCVMPKFFDAAHIKG
jgi:hypothetical protein